MTFHAFLRGEDRTEFTIELSAPDADAARRMAEDRYPEASIVEIFDPVERAADIQDRARRRMDAEDMGYYDDYDVYYDDDYS